MNHAFPTSCPPRPAGAPLRSLLTLAVALATACSAPTIAQPAAAVSVYKSFGSRQCGEPGLSRTQIERQLGEAGVPVLAFACGSDGRMRPQMCGAPDGRIAIVEVPADRVAAATRAGFTALSELPDALRQPCPGS
jgi:hypothetical protein